MPRYRCPVCKQEGFESMFDVQYHARENHGRNVKAIEYRFVSANAARAAKVLREKRIKDNSFAFVVNVERRAKIEAAKRLRAEENAEKQE